MRHATRPDHMVRTTIWSVQLSTCIKCNIFVVNPFIVEFIYMASSAECAGLIIRPVAVKGLNYMMEPVNIRHFQKFYPVKYPVFLWDLLVALH